MKSLLNLFTLPAHQLGNQDKVESYLKKHGKVTNREILQITGGNDCYKIAFRLREKGIITRTTKEPNAHNSGWHSVYWVK